MSKQLINRDSLPLAIKQEVDDLFDKNIIKLKRIKPFEVIQLSTTDDKEVIITDSTSSNIFLSEAIKQGLTAGTGSLKVGDRDKRIFSNFGNISSTTTVSSLYEHFRGYVYRDFGSSADKLWNSYLTTTAGVCGLIISKSSGIGTTGIRFMMMNRNFYNDRIKPRTWRMIIKPASGISVSNSRGLQFENELLNNSNSGAYASITGQEGLTGSLSAGISGCFLTGFSIFLQIKPINAGPIRQTLFMRKSGDFSQSALNYNLTSGKNNTLVNKKYSTLNPLSSLINSYFFTFYSSSLPNLASSSITASTSTIIQVTNKGGGIYRWAVSSNSQFLKTKIEQNIPVLNGNFSSQLDYWYNPDDVTQLDASAPEGNTIRYSTETNGQMSGPHMKISAGYRQGLNRGAYKAFEIPHGTSGMIVSFDLTATGDIKNNQMLLANVKIGHPITADAGWTLSSFLDDYGKIGNPGIITRRNLHINLIPRAPIREWGMLGEKASTAWVGFEFYTGTSGEPESLKEYHIDNIQVQYVPSTIYGISSINSTTATITAWFDSSITSNLKVINNFQADITIYNREKSKELCPNNSICTFKYIDNNYYFGQPF